MTVKHIEWDDAYLLGLKEVDAQHKHLFEIVNKIYALEKSPHVKAEIKTILHELNDYMGEHFHDEEIYMESIRFPDLETHRQHHANIIEQLIQFVKTPNHRLDILQTKMRVMAKRILIDHIIHEDMKIKSYLEQRAEMTDEEIVEL